MKKQLITLIVPVLSAITMTFAALPVSAAAEKPLTDADVTAESMYVHTGNTEADEVFNTYVDTAIKMIDLGKDNYGGDYSDSCEQAFSNSFASFCGATTEQRELIRHRSHMEMFLWTECYVDLCSLIEYHSDYLESWDVFRQKGILENRLAHNLKKIRADEATVKEQMDAYEKVMQYQFDYYSVHRTVWCFFTGQEYNLIGGNDYSSYFGDAPVTTQSGTEQSEEQSDQNTGTQISTWTETVTRAETTVTTTQTGIWYHVGQKLKGMWFTITLLCVFLIALGVFMIVKKKKGL